MAGFQWLSMSSNDPSSFYVPTPVAEVSNQFSMQAINYQTSTGIGPVAILWDLENCPVPADVSAEDVAGNIRLALRVHPAVGGTVTVFSAYGDFNKFPKKLREGCQRTGVNLIDVPSGKKDAADKAILVDMFLYALDYPPPSTIFLISGDVDFAPALHKLGQRGYIVVLAIPAAAGVSSALISSGQFVWNWPSVARGEGLVPAKYYLHGHPELSCYPNGPFLCNNYDVPNGEETIVYKGISNISSVAYFKSNMAPGPSRSTQFSSPVSSSHQTHVSAPGSTVFVQPGDIEGLKEQLLKLVSMCAGSMSLKDIPSEYHNTFGRPLYLAEYNCKKLVHLVKKMSDVFCIEGIGAGKVLSIKRSAIKTMNLGYVGSNVNLLTSNEVNREEQCPRLTDQFGAEKLGSTKADKRLVNEDDCLQVNTVIDGENLNLEGYAHTDALQLADVNPEIVVTSTLKVFRKELEELLVSHACKILASHFLPLYRQRYGKDLDFSAYGVEGLEALLNKVADLAVLQDDQDKKLKFIIANCGYRSNLNR